MYKLSNKAKLDLAEIRKNSKQHWGSPRTKKYLKSVKLRLRELDEQSFFHRSADYIRPKLFQTKCGSHVVFYTIETNHIFIARVLHKNMDFGRHI